MVDEIRMPQGTSYIPTPLGEYLIQCQAGEPCAVELYDGQQVADDVERWSVRDLGRGAVRGVVLYVDDGSGRPRLAGKEGGREDVRRWLTSMGVPALRVGHKKSK